MSPARSYAAHSVLPLEVVILCIIQRTIEAGSSTRHNLSVWRASFFKLAYKLIQSASSSTCSYEDVIARAREIDEISGVEIKQEV